MADPVLLQEFQKRLRYMKAKPWQKPFLDPTRFTRNQMRKCGLLATKVGEQRQTDTFHMRHFTIVNGEIVSEIISAYGVFEDALTAAFLRLIRAEQVVVDIGMHLGYYTTLFARLVGPKGEVHGFEPTPSTREIAYKNVAQYPNVTVHPFAVWSSACKIPFRDYGPQWMAFNSFSAARMESCPPPLRLFDVETIMLDEFRRKLGRTVALLKIDAESAELEILRGAERVLEADQPLLSLEVGDFGGQHGSRVLIDFLEQRGYRPWCFLEGHWQAHEPKESYDYDNLIFAPVGRDLSGEYPERSR